MPPGVRTKSKMEQLLARISQLEAMVFATPLLHRKDVARLLGVSERTVSRRLARGSFPEPLYDAGRPKWMPGQFAGQNAGQPVSA